MGETQKLKYKLKKEEKVGDFAGPLLFSATVSSLSYRVP